MDVSWKWLNFFMEDDARLARIGGDYGSGRMLTGEIKAELVQVGCNLELFENLSTCSEIGACCRAKIKAELVQLGETSVPFSYAV